MEKSKDAVEVRSLSSLLAQNIANNGAFRHSRHSLWNIPYNPFKADINIFQRPCKIYSVPVQGLGLFRKRLLVALRTCAQNRTILRQSRLYSQPWTPPSTTMVPNLLVSFFKARWDRILYFSWILFYSGKQCWMCQAGTSVATASCSILGGWPLGVVIVATCRHHYLKSCCVFW